MKTAPGWLSRLYTPLLEFVFPPVCLACEAWLDFRQSSGPIAPRRNRADDSSRDEPPVAEPELWWCAKCLAQMVADPERCCPYCHAHSYQERFRNQRCRLCRGKKLRFDSALAVGNYPGLLQQQVLRMKGLRDEPLAWQLGQLLAAKRNRLTVGYDMWQRIDAVIPIPIHWWKRLQRGFQASQVIAEGFCSATGIPLWNTVLYCRRLTGKQGLLSTPERFRNVADAFDVKLPQRLAGKRVLLVDDVMTSGATLAYATQALKRHGAVMVLAGVLARGTRHQ